MLDNVMQGRQKDVKRPRRSRNAYTAGFGVEQSVLVSNCIVIYNWDLL